MPDNKDINRVAGGLKAAIHNPNVSEAAKDHAQERLDQINQSEESDVGQESTRVLAGYKATLSVSPWFSWERRKSPTCSTLERTHLTSGQSARTRDIGSQWIYF